MRIVVHDYSGHPFQVQLSRKLAERGHEVLHLYSASFQTPRGSLTRQPSDPEGFAIEGVQISGVFQKTSFVKRWQQEREYGRAARARIEQYRPDIVLSSNSPIDTQEAILRGARAVGAKFYFWLQDIYSEAIYRILSRKWPGLGHAIGIVYKAKEFSQYERSDGVVAITEDFVPVLRQRDVPSAKIHVVENWAPLDELPRSERANAWAKANMAKGKQKIIYSGTLGMKHNPQLLIELARNTPDAHLYVFSEGETANYLNAEAQKQGLDNVSVAPWVPFEELPNMLAGGDVLIAMIEADAGVFCVPSKVLTYFCCGRPVLAAIPEGNLARRLIEREQAGMVASPDNITDFVEKAKALIQDQALRDTMGDNARGYAETTFNIDSITDRFERIFAA